MTQGFLRALYALLHGPNPPSLDQSDHRGGKNEIYNREKHLVGPFLVHKIFWVPLPPPYPTQKKRRPAPKVMMSTSSTMHSLNGQDGGPKTLGTLGAGGAAMKAS